jgi:hypothetical protein
MGSVGGFSDQGILELKSMLLDMKSSVDHLTANKNVFDNKAKHHMSPDSNSNKETTSPKSIGTPYLPAPGPNKSPTPESEEGDRTSNALKVGK